MSPYRNSEKMTSDTDPLQDIEFYKHEKGLARLFVYKQTIAKASFDENNLNSLKAKALDKFHLFSALTGEDNVSQGYIWLAELSFDNSKLFRPFLYEDPTSESKEKKVIYNKIFLPIGIAIGSTVGWLLGHFIF